MKDFDLEKLLQISRYFANGAKKRKDVKLFHMDDAIFRADPHGGLSEKEMTVPFIAAWVSELKLMHRH